MNFLFLLLLLKICQQLLYFLYLAQLKEYRLDRIIEHLERRYSPLFTRYLHITILAPITFKKLPKPTGKAIGVVVISSLIIYVLINFFGSIGIIVCILASPLIIMSSIFLFWLIEWLVRQLLYSLASKKTMSFKKKYNLTVVGITGSYGKSSTKYFVTQLLSKKFSALQTPGSVNTPLGISKTILFDLKPSHQFLIIEMGAYKVGEIKHLCDLVRPDIGIITGIGNQHLALFGSQENIISAKSELLLSLPSSGVAIINNSSRFLPVFNQKKPQKIYYYGKNKSSLLSSIPSNQTAIPSFLQTNLEPAIILAKMFNIPDVKIIKTIKTLSLTENTMQKTTGYNNATIINDSRNSNPEGVLAILEYISTLDFENKFLIMPCLIELGNEAPKIHRQIGRKLAEISIKTAITTNDYYADIASSAGKNAQLFLIEDVGALLSWIKRNVTKRSVVVIEGKVNYQVVNFLLKKNV